MTDKIKITVTITRECASEVNSAITKYLGGWTDEDDNFTDSVDKELERVGEVFEKASVNNKTITNK